MDHIRQISVKFDLRDEKQRRACEFLKNADHSSLGSNARIISEAIERLIGENEGEEITVILSEDSVQRVSDMILKRIEDRGWLFASQNMRDQAVSGREDTFGSNTKQPKLDEPKMSAEMLAFGLDDDE